MKLGKKDARAVRELLSGGKVYQSVLSKEIVALLENDGMISVERLNRRSRSIQAKNIDAMQKYFSRKFGISDIDVYIDILAAENLTRSELVGAGMDTKIRSINPKSGMHINSLNGAVVTIDGESVSLNFPSRCALFVHKNATVVLPTNAIVVGVENFENITFAAAQKKIFGYDIPVVFAERGPVMRSWIAELPNRYIHFGDIDLAGIGIYLNEFVPYLHAEHSFFLPSNVEELLRGNNNPKSQELYEKQLHQYGSISTDEPQLQHAIELIHMYKRGIEQELFINC